MPWMEPHERQTEALLHAIHKAAQLIATSIREGFIHMASVEDAALADLTASITALADSVAAEIQALQAAINAQGVNNSPAIEASVSKINQLVSDLKTSLPTATPAPAPTA